MLSNIRSTLVNKEETKLRNEGEREKEKGRKRVALLLTFKIDN